MMLILSVLISTILNLSGAQTTTVKYYASKYDHIDVEAILNNRRMVNYYSACLLSKGVCPPEGIELKRILPEALQSNCARCSEKQAVVALRAIKRLRKEYPKIWSQLQEKWDPNDIYVKRFEATSSSSSAATTIKAFTTTATVSTTTAKATTTAHLNPSSISHEITTKTHKTTSSVTTKLPKKITTTTNPPVTTSTTTSTPPRPAFIPGLLPINTFFTNPPIPIRPIVNLNLGTNIGATVSGLVRGLGAIGSRVMETGAEIAEVVIKNIVKPLPL